NRLQGESFREEYITTPQIQVANIQWNYNQTNDVIKVEIWDVVDKGISPTNINKRSTTSNSILKIDNSQGILTKPPSSGSLHQSPDQLSLDAETIDVYRNTHGLILLFDMTKNWTFEYAVKELRAIPKNMAVLLLGNFSDLSSQRVISQSQIYQAIADINRERISEYPSANMVRDILRQQLAAKTKELAKLLDTLDLDDNVSSSVKSRLNVPMDVVGIKEPDLGKDRLEEEQMQLKNLWDKEFKELSKKKEPVESLSLPLEQQVIQPLSDTLLHKRSKAIIPDTTIIDEFDAGDLEDDFFDDTPDPVVVLPPVVLPKNDEVEDMDSKNPMVTIDEEDLIGVEGYDDVEDDKPNKPNVHQSFNDVWRHRHNSVSLANQISDSSDDDLTQAAKHLNLLDRRPSTTKIYIDKSMREDSNLEVHDDSVDEHGSFTYSGHGLSINDPYIKSEQRDLHHGFEESSFDMAGYSPISFGTPSGYEEIGEGQDNPWLEGDTYQPEHKDLDDNTPPITQTQAIPKGYEFFSTAAESTRGSTTEYHRS
ncbi:6035_t:CDS:2, partial [Scutellospora calospora]